MNRIFKTFIFLLLCLSADLGFAQTVDTSFANSYFVKREAYFEELPIKPKAIVFLGNSITQAGEWSELFDDKKVINRGISGDVTYGVLNRLPFLLSQKPKKIFLAIGVNDIKRGTSVDDVSRNNERIIKVITERAPHTKLYVQSILPVNEGMLADIYSKITNDRINKVNQKLKELTLKYGCVYIDLHKTDLKSADGQLKNELSTDGLHLQPIAYIIWANYLKSLKYIK